MDLMVFLSYHIMPEGIIGMICLIILLRNIIIIGMIYEKGLEEVEEDDIIHKVKKGMVWYGMIYCGASIFILGIKP